MGNISFYDLDSSLSDNQFNSLMYLIKTVKLNDKSAVSEANYKKIINYMSINFEQGKKLFAEYFNRFHIISFYVPYNIRIDALKFIIKFLFIDKKINFDIFQTYFYGLNPEDKVKGLKENIKQVKFTYALRELQKEGLHDFDKYIEDINFKTKSVAEKNPLIDTMIKNDALSDIRVYDPYIIFKGDDAYLHMYNNNKPKKDMLKDMNVKFCKGLYKSRFNIKSGLEFIQENGNFLKVKLNKLEKQFIVKTSVGNFDIMTGKTH